MQLSSWHAQQLVFVDESVFNLCISDRKYDWAAVRKQAVMMKFFQKEQHYSILSAYTINSYIVWEVYEERVNTDMFNDFIQDKVLHQCEQFSEPHSVLCMNNCRIHHSEIGFHTNISILANSVD